MSSPYEYNTSSSWRHSLLSFFRSSSPERGSRTSIHVASVARFSPAGPGASNSATSSNSQSPRLINISDFADSSLSESDQLHDLENIFLVIEEYAREPTFHFTEEMAGAVAAMVEARDTSGELGDVRGPEVELQPGSRPASGGSLSSGALLDHLDNNTNATGGSTPPFRTPQSSFAPRVLQTPKSHSSYFGASPHLAPPDVQPTFSNSLRLSHSPPRIPAPIYAAAEPSRDWAPLPENAPLARSHTRDSRTSDILSMFSAREVKAPVNHPKSSHVADLDVGHSDFVDLEKRKAGPVAVLWARWAVVQLCALVALPVFFLVAFGIFDRGGYAERPRGPGLGRVYYTRAQRMLSLALGLIWLAIVFAMVGMGFGLIARRHL